MVHLGARTGFVQELQMSHRQTWLIRRDMAKGSPWGHAWRRCPGVTLRHAFVEGRPAYFINTGCIVAARAARDSAHRFAAVLPLGAPSLGPDPSLAALRVWETPLDMAPGEATRPARCASGCKTLANWQLRLG